MCRSRACACPGRAAGPYLPFDAPYRPTNLPRSSLKGLVWDADLGTKTTPIQHPFSAYQSESFPTALGSNVSPDLIKPKMGLSLNHFSPVHHTRSVRIAEKLVPVPARRQSFVGRTKGPQRIQGRVTTWPAVNPLWKSIFGGWVE